MSRDRNEANGINLDVAVHVAGTAGVAGHTAAVARARDGAITLGRSKAPRAGRLLTPRHKAYQMPRL